MEQYKLDNDLDANKVFLVQRSKLENRIDPNPYSQERIQIIKLLQKNNTLLKFKEVIKSNKSVAKSINSEDIYIGLENIISDTGEYIETADKESISSANTFKKGQILFPKLRPYLNKVYYTEFEGLCSTEFHVLESKSHDFDTEFLSIYLRLSLVVKQTKHLMTGNTLPRLQTSDIENLPIPKIDIAIQQQIVDIYNNAYSQKQAKEAEAKELLASIDTYLLNELGITLPEKDNSLETRIFTTKFSEVAGGRLDPFGIVGKSLKIEGGRYNNVFLKKIAFLQKGQSITSDKIIEGLFPVIAGGQSSPYNHNVYNHKGNVITVSASGAYSGYVWYHDYPIFASDCTMIYSKDESFITTIFLSEILKCKQSEIYNLQQGAGQPHVYARDLEKLNIPIPPIEKQNEIAKHISDIRAEVKRLQKEAIIILEDTKQQVEQIILG